MVRAGLRDTLINHLVQDSCGQRFWTPMIKLADCVVFLKWTVLLVKFQSFIDLLRVIRIGISSLWCVDERLDTVLWVNTANARMQRPQLCFPPPNSPPIAGLEHWVNPDEATVMLVVFSGGRQEEPVLVIHRTISMFKATNSCNIHQRPTVDYKGPWRAMRGIYLYADICGPFRASLTLQTMTTGSPKQRHPNVKESTSRDASTREHGI